MKYEDFISKKTIESVDCGFNPKSINEMLFDFQKDIARWILKKGRAAIFADCGLGKTPMQLEFAKQVSKNEKGNVLIIAPLAVSQQTIREGNKFGVDVKYCRKQDDVKPGITITNYEMMDKFEPSYFCGIVLDESSILKSFTGKIRTEIIEKFKDTKYKLACTATPAPNDFMELGNHAEFLGVMTLNEMLSMYFVHDGGETQKWRLKGHAQDDFWKWVCSWAVMIRKPSDLGYNDGKFILPELKINEIKCDTSELDTGDNLFRLHASTLQERIKERRETISIRTDMAAKIANSNNDQWLVWCDLNEESAQLKKKIDGSIEVKGSDPIEHKEKSMIGFSDGSIRVLVTKPSIAGFGMNWQHCHNVIFVGLTDSYEYFYQAIRRCWRFGQKNEVQCNIVYAETEGAVVANIKRKEKDAEKMAEEMVKNMHVYNQENITGTKRESVLYKTNLESGKNWKVYLGDCVEESKKIDDCSIDYSIFSPPFASLYTYSNSPRDMGNCKDESDFMDHFQYLVKELFRITKDGRLCSFHCMNLPSSKCRDGFIGIKDFRGTLIRCFESEGWIFHSEVCIWKDPVVAMQRTKAIGLLHKQLVKDSCLSRQGIPDYLVTMRKPGENKEPVHGELDYFCGDESTFKNNGRLSIDVWQRYASPVWMDIRPGNTLQKDSARDEKDERHICPLQLDVIERGIQLWSNPGNTVFSPFAGIGSEGHVSVKTGRKFIGIELKESYWKQAVKNLRNIENETMQDDLFSQVS